MLIELIDLYLATAQIEFWKDKLRAGPVVPPLLLLAPCLISVANRLPAIFQQGAHTSKASPLPSYEHARIPSRESSNCRRSFLSSPRHRLRSLASWDTKPDHHPRAVSVASVLCSAAHDAAPCSAFHASRSDSGAQSISSLISIANVGFF